VDVHASPTEADVIPVADLMEHERGTACPCDPRWSLVDCTDGTTASLFTHNAADRRELAEQDHGGA
jgi:hypothetical protein